MLIPPHEIFYVAGTPVVGSDGTTIAGQMYVERYPAIGPSDRPPIVLIHGTGQTGAGFVSTADGRPGWLFDFLEAGYETFVVDQVGRGRSGTDSRYGGLARMTLEDVEALFARTEYDRRHPVAHFHNQWPSPTDRHSHRSFLASQQSFLSDARVAEQLNLTALEALLDDIGGAALLTHSQSSAFGFGLSDRRPDLVLAHITVEPNGPPFFDLSYAPESWDEPQRLERPYGITRMPLTFDPPLGPGQTLPWRSATSDGPEGLTQGWVQETPPRGLPRLAQIPTAIVTGAASYRTYVDPWTSKFLRDAAVPHDHIRLADLGIQGNGHLMMLEQNSQEISSTIITWLDHHVAITTRKM
jgi:pimeloyl-ACP methyl ester carboxylesterase